MYEKITAEIDEVLGDVAADIVPVDNLELKLPYLNACLNENFRINPVFTMPLERQVTSPEGFEIEGELVPKGVRGFITIPRSCRG